MLSVGHRVPLYGGVQRVGPFEPQLVVVGLSGDEIVGVGHGGQGKVDAPRRFQDPQFILLKIHGIQHQAGIGLVVLQVQSLIGVPVAAEPVDPRLGSYRHGRGGVGKIFGGPAQGQAA